ncbi:hypothetical protein BH24GEM1_BH24GEM1_26510 [soil metagenome]
MQESLTQLPGPAGERYVELFRHGTLSVELFVPAGVAHRFEDFTDDLAVWVLFYGPDGWEAAG